MVKVVETEACKVGHDTAPVDHCTPICDAARPADAVAQLEVANVEKWSGFICPAGCSGYAPLAPAEHRRDLHGMADLWHAVAHPPTRPKALFRVRGIVAAPRRSRLGLRGVETGRALGQVPFGYTRGADGRLTVNDSETETLARMRELRAHGLTYQQVADELGREGRPTKTGARWAPMTVHKILRRAA